MGAPANKRDIGGRDRAIVLGCAIDRLDMDGTVSRCKEIVEAGRHVRQVSINAAKLVAMRSDTALREAIEGCELVSADGQSIVWASRLLGDPLPERVAGIDLMDRLLAMAEEEGFGIYVLGARREVLEAGIVRLRQRFPRLQIAGYRDGYFAEEESREVAAEVGASGAQILFVAISSPRKELWLAEHADELGVSLTMGVGGAIDVIAGVTRRAPRSWQRLGLEWLYRLLQEPRRLLGRYLASNARFGAMVLNGVAHRLIGIARDAWRNIASSRGRGG